MHALPFVLLLSAGAAAQHSAFEASLSRFEAKIGVAILRNYNRGATSLGAATKEVLGGLVVASKK